MRRLAGALTVLGVALSTLAVAPAHAADPVYTITDVSRLWFYGDSADPTACRSRYQNTLQVSVAATVQDPVWEGQVHVKGLSIAVYAGTKRLGTVPLAEAYLEPDGGQGSNFFTVSCKKWRTLLARGFGGPRRSYGVQVVGQGRAFDSNDGSPAGTVVAPSTRFSAAMPQIARFTQPTGKRAGNRIVLSTRIQVWSKRGARYGWSPMRSKPVTLLTMSPNGGRFVKASSARTSKRGTVSLGFRPSRENYVRLRLRRSSYGEQVTYHVTRQGRVSPAGR